MKRAIVEFMIRDHSRKFVNYDSAVAPLRIPPPKFEAGNRIRIHKRNTRKKLPKLSILLLDWSCRELFDRVMPQVMDHADVVVTCHQREPYHKHEGYNAGLLLAAGELFCVCDSDA